MGASRGGCCGASGSNAPSWACSAIRGRSKVNQTDEECVDVVIRRAHIDGLHSTQLTDSYYDTILLIIKGGGTTEVELGQCKANERNGRSRMT